MEERSVTHNTFVIERSYPATPERVFDAFADPAKKRRWFIESHSHVVEEYEMDFRPGGAEHARYRFKDGTPLAGIELTSESRYQDIVANRRIVLAYSMSLSGTPMSASLATVELWPEDKGTRLHFTHQGAYFERADGPKMREEGWRKLLEQLAKELAR